MFGACNPFHNRMASLVFGSFSRVKCRIGFNTVDESFQRREMASSRSTSLLDLLLVFEASQYFLNLHFLPVQMVSSIGPSHMVAMHKAVAAIVAIWGLDIQFRSGALESFRTVL